MAHSLAASARHLYRYNGEPLCFSFSIYISHLAIIIQQGYKSYCIFQDVDVVIMGLTCISYRGPLDIIFRPITLHFVIRHNLIKSFLIGSFILT